MDGRRAEGTLRPMCGEPPKQSAEEDLDRRILFPIQFTFLVQNSTYTHPHTKFLISHPTVPLFCSLIKSLHTTAAPSSPRP